MGTAFDEIIVAVDGGGTGCRVAIYDMQKRVLASTQGGPANIFSNTQSALHNVLDTVATAADRAGLSRDAIAQSTAHLGLAGIIAPSDAEKVVAVMPFARVTATDDRATALAGAFDGGDGVLVSVGTGSFVAAQIDHNVQYFGGWGSQLSDQASGAWLGRGALERTLMAHDGVVAHSDLTRTVLNHFEDSPLKLVHFAKNAAPSDIAALAPQVARAAQAQDAHGQALMQGGADYLMACLRAVQLTPGMTICLTGGIGPHYTPYLESEMRARLQPAKGSALDGAFYLARDNLSKIGRLA